MARARTAVVAAALIAAVVAPPALGGPAAFAAASPVATAAETGPVVQEGGRLTVPAGEEGAVTLRFTATLAPGVRGPVSAVLRLPTMLVEIAGGPPVSEDVIRSTCAVGGVAYGACLWDMPYAYDDRPVDPPSLALPTVTVVETAGPKALAYTVTLDADRTAIVLGTPDARVELKDGTGASVAEGTVRLDFVRGTPPPDGRGAVHARDRSGVLWRYEGTGDVRRPFATRKRVGGGWNVYTAVTPLRSPDAAGHGSLVARDRSGVLWLYEGTGNPDAPFAPRERVGGGWNVYTSATGYGRSGLVARDRDGVLWAYDSNHGSGGPFEPRQRVGGGWNTYNALTPSGYNDGVLARDRSGVLWKYDHPGHAPSAPFVPRQRVGGGWNVYTALAGTGELGRDDTPDVVARDTAGRLWLYQGVRRPVSGSGWEYSLVPGPTRTLVGGGWNAYDLIF
ncbi:hypothetical protein [Streptomyces sp. Qhu_M48]|uniref:hypothetical protein n=1 Tax=Streptomyces sp. Qhu_M48 TaxID=3435889 RepID=UPI003F50B2CB